MVHPATAFFAARAFRAIDLPAIDPVEGVTVWARFLERMLPLAAKSRGSHDRRESPRPSGKRRRLDLGRRGFGA